MQRKTNGGLAQLGEHLLCKQGVNGSIPLASTKYWVERVVVKLKGIGAVRQWVLI